MDLLVDGAGKNTEIDAHRLMSRLWQGSYPRDGALLRDLGFSVLVLCAFELQTPGAFPEVTTLLCPMDDNRLSAREAQQAHEMARRVVAMHGAGHRILVTCAAGRNRSGLVSALALRLLTGCTGLKAREMVQRGRPNALTNPWFAAYLDGLPAPRVTRPGRQGRVHPVPA